MQCCNIVQIVRITIWLKKLVSFAEIRIQLKIWEKNLQMS